MGPLSILIVDDDPSYRAMLRTALNSGQLAVVGEAGNGLEALRLVRERQPELVILDIQMPVMSGLQALSELRRVASDCQVIVHSGRDDADSRAAARTLGAAGFVAKGELAALRRTLLACAARNRHSSPSASGAAAAPGAPLPDLAGAPPRGDFSGDGHLGE